MRHLKALEVKYIFEHQVEKDSDKYKPTNWPIPTAGLLLTGESVLTMYKGNMWKKTRHSLQKPTGLIVLVVCYSSLP